jgi:aspartyl-tRNA(Asn)/glutamyl-tRNA(Gln) amidotransferase subunit C
MSAAITAEDVRKVARLARLALTDAEVEKFAHQLGDVLKYVDLLGEVATDDVAPMAHPVEMANVFRADEPQSSLPREAALVNAPQQDGRYFLVPPILEQG